MRSPSRLALMLAAVAAMAWGCGSPDDNNDAQQKGADNKPAAVAPALPSRLPVVTDQASVEPTLRELINLAVTHAVGAPKEDQSPEIVATSDFACGVKVKAMTCAPTTASEKVIVYINPGVAWQQFQQEVGHGGGDIPVQNSALGAAVQYLTYRNIQRTHPELLDASLASDDATFAKIAQMTMCANGQVYGGLHGIMQ
ncbi:MAG TPA: hypothetical protein VJM46_04530, partial [Candidatus Saccharimonadales bacterium]|nr:hypothetical protein [Candidatus Saccharimonadales bacterium]